MLPDPAASTRPTARAGIAMMLGAVLLFSLNDVLAKWLVAGYAVGQIMVLRSLGSLALLAPFAWRRMRHTGWRLPHRGLQGARVFFGTAEAACFYWAIAFMPLADAVTFWMAAPIYVTALSALLLGERVGMRRALLVLVGFAGVAVALGGGLEVGGLPALIAFTGSLLYALFLVSARRLRETPDVVLAALQMAGGLVFGLALLPFTGWTAPSARDLVLLLLLGLASCLGNIGVTRALKLAPASTVVPYQYSFILWAALFGWLFFGDVPDLPILIGAAVVVASGLALFRLESRPTAGA
jgi:drug/metabolite transporter (DMT)-like permease